MMMLKKFDCQYWGLLGMEYDLTHRRTTLFQFADCINFSNVSTFYKN